RVATAAPPQFCNRPCDTCRRTCCVRLDVFHLAAGLAIDMYRRPAGFPESERFGRTSQMRRAAVSVPANIGEGAEPTSQKEFLHHIDIVAGSSEVRYLLAVSRRVGFGDQLAAEQFEARYDAVIRALQALRTALRRQPG